MTEISLKSKVMKKNDRIAENLRSMLHKHTIFGLNLIGSPGSGKTTLLEAVLPGLIKKLHCGVIEGDVKTDNDMKRIAALGVPAVQIETQGSCHLNAEMVMNTIDRFSLPSLDMLIIENVGNLICPVSYDLGEDCRVIVLSITEGDDKPLKYPSAFISADVLVITKVDLEPYVDANVETMKSNALSLNPGLKVFKTSAKNGEGIDSFADFLVNMCNVT